MKRTNTMLVQFPDGLYRSDKIAFRNLFYGFTTRRNGDMRVGNNRAAVLSQLNTVLTSAIFAQQVHGNKVYTAHDQNLGTTIPEVDGVVYAGKGKAVLGVFGGDCLPILAGMENDDVESSAVSDPVLGAVHAGWRGVFGGVIPALIAPMVRHQISPQRLKVVIGPHIRSCCYNVAEARATIAVELFGKNAVSFRQGKYFLDLTQIALKQFESEGIDIRNIDSDSPCTACTSEMFYSFRHDSKADFGEIMGVIGKYN